MRPDRSPTILSREDLSNVGRLVELQRHLAGQGIIERSDTGLLRMVAAAEMALRTAREPAKRFARVILRRHWDAVSEEDLQTARNRIATYRRETGAAGRGIVGIQKRLPIE